MSKVIAAITTSVDGYITGPNDVAGNGLGDGGERLHNWVMGGSWSYDSDHGFNMSGPDKEFYDELVHNVGAGIVGRGMYEASGQWGGQNPFGGTLIVLTHRVEDQPPEDKGFLFISGFDEALAQAKQHADDKDVAISGGANVIRQALAAGAVDELVISTAPVILGAGKRLFDGFTDDIELEVVKTISSPFATHNRYKVKR